MVASTSNISRRNTPTAANIAFDSLPTLPVLDVGGVEYGVSVLKRATTDGSLKLGDGNATVVIEGLAAILMTGKASCVDEGDSKESFIVLDTWRALPMIEELGSTTGAELTASANICSDELGATATEVAGGELWVMTMFDWIDVLGITGSETEE